MVALILALPVLTILADAVALFGGLLMSVVEVGQTRTYYLSHVFGAGRASDAFWLAWTVPSVFRRFVADEGLTGALIPAVGQGAIGIECRELDERTHDLIRRCTIPIRVPLKYRWHCYLQELTI